MTPKFHFDLVQGSPQWHRLRAYNFTASNLGPFAAEPIRITLTVDELKATLDGLGIDRKGLTKRDELIAKLPNPAAYLTLCDGAKTAIFKQIKQEQVQRIKDAIAEANEAGELYPITELDDIVLRREEELEAQSEKQFGYNIPIKYGKLLEPYARRRYERLTGYEVTECGFIEHESGGWGCSPDGLIGKWETVSIEPPSGSYNIPISENSELLWMLFRPSHGVEIKCPIPETHMEWLDAGGLPSDHRMQVHVCMAASGFNRWDFLSFCPGYPDLLVTVKREKFTDQLEAGIQTLVEEKTIMAAKFEKMKKS